MKKIFAISLAALVLFGCAKEADTVIGKKVSYQVKIESTKAVLADGTHSGYSIKWKEGDKIAFQLSDDSVQEAVVTVDGTGAHVSVTLPDATSVTDAWFPSNNKVKPTGIPATQVAETMNIPLVKSSIVGNTITFTEVVNWAIIRVPLKKGANGDARTLQFIKVKTNNAALDPQVIQLNTKATLTDEVQNFDFVVPVGEYTPVEFIVRDSHDLEYRRKAAANFTTASHTVYSINTIDDVDDTGKHIWFMGSASATANAAETPILYWWKQKGANNSTTIDAPTPDDENPDDIVYNDGYTTITMADKASAMTDFQAWVTPCFNKFYSKDGSTSSNARDKDFPIYVTENHNGQIPFVAVHTGNYPIFAIKMSNPANYGSSRKIRFQTDARDALDGLAATNFVDAIGHGDNKYSYLEGYDSEDVTVIYYNLSTANIGGKGVLPNTRVIPFKTWQLRFYDVHYDTAQDSAPTFNLYWAGFFNSENELKAFAASH